MIYLIQLKIKICKNPEKELSALETELAVKEERELREKEYNHILNKDLNLKKSN